MSEQNDRKNAIKNAEKYVRNGGQKYVRNKFQKICQIRMSENTPERILIEISDKNTRRYIRENMNRNIQYMLDKIVKTYIRRNIRKEGQKIYQKECQKI